MPIRERMFTPDFSKVAPLLEGALAREGADDPVAAVFGSAALGVARAAELLTRQYTLVATNVPYLTRQKQADNLRTYIDASSRKLRLISLRRSWPGAENYRYLVERMQ